MNIDASKKEAEASRDVGGTVKIVMSRLHIGVINRLFEYVIMCQGENVHQHMFAFCKITEFVKFCNLNIDHWLMLTVVLLS